MTTKITKIILEPKSPGYALVHFEDDGAVSLYSVQLARLNHFLVELFYQKPYEPVMIGDVVHEEAIRNILLTLGTSLTGTAFGVTDDGEMMYVTVLNGDTKRAEKFFGASALLAIKQMLDHIGFQSKLDLNKLDVPGDTITVTARVDDFIYGIQKRSNEILKAELNAEFDSVEGAW